MLVPTGAPEGLTVIALNSSTVQVSWEPPPLYTQNGPIGGYILSVTGISSDENFEIFSHQGPNVLIISYLHPFYTYTYTIAAIGTGVGPFSPALSLQMPEEGNYSFASMPCMGGSSVFTE